MEETVEELPPLPTEGETKEVVVAVKPEKKPKKTKAKGKKPSKPKAAKKVAKTKAKAKVVKPAGREIGPGTKKFKFKAIKLMGKCDVLGCSKSAKSPRSFRCAKHTKAVRKEQLKQNNVTWKERIEEGTAKHHAVYTDPGSGKQRVTEWAALNPDKAKAYVKAEKSIVDLKTFVPLLSKYKEKLPAKRQAKGSKVKTKKAA